MAISCAVLAMSHGVAYAVTGNGCSDEKNEYINPELGLCSVHAYNIGRDTNGTAEEHAIVQNVIALKSTVITQQMKRQYDYMDAMLKRFRIQLEKAVLQTKAAANGASTSASGAAFTSNDKNIKLAGAQNCMTASYQNIYACLTGNVQIVINAINGGNNITDAKKQLISDLEVASTWKIIKNISGTENYKDLSKCNELKNKNKRDDILSCAQALGVSISMAQRDEEYKSRQNRGNGTNSWGG